MTGIILAAGIGRRLWPLTADRPKCLLPLPVAGGCTLARLVFALDEAPVDRLVVVVGYLRGEIWRALEVAEPRMPVRLIVNDAYRDGSVRSLHAAREYLEDDVVIADADVLLPHALVWRMIDAEAPNAFLFDPTVEARGEEMMLMMRQDRVVNIGRVVERSDWDQLGESLGFLKLDREAARALRMSLTAMVENESPLGDYELAFRPVLASFAVGAISAAGEPWTEIDTPADLVMAARSVAPRIADLERRELRRISHQERICRSGK